MIDFINEFVDSLGTGREGMVALGSIIAYVLLKFILNFMISRVGSVNLFPPTEMGEKLKTMLDKDPYHSQWARHGAYGLRWAPSHTKPAIQINYKRSRGIPVDILVNNSSVWSLLRRKERRNILATANRIAKGINADLAEQRKQEHLASLNQVVQTSRVPF